MQDDLFSRLKPGSFDRITIPVLSVKVRTGSSAAMHKYPYRPGVDIEYTGREPISGTITAAYFSGLGILSSDVLWPGTLQRLRERVQEQRSGELVVPTLGVIPKAHITLDEDYDPSRRDGAMVTIQFTEDSKDRFSSARVDEPRAAALTAAARVDIKISQLNLESGLVDPASYQTAFTFQPDLSSSSLSTRTDFATFLSGVLFAYQSGQTKIANFFTDLDRVIGRARELLDTVSGLRRIENIEAISALRDLIDSCAAIKDQIAGTNRVKFFRVVADSTAAAIAVATRNTVEEILNLNPLPDANAIQAGELLLVFEK